MTDDLLEAMSVEERRDLAVRLARFERPEQPGAAERRRRRFVTVAAAGSVVLVPWIAVLALTLPHRYVAAHWTLAWVGFDVALLAGLATTAYLAWRARPTMIVPALITATLLVCDAWFDTTTADRSDRLVSALSALLVELPMAVVLIAAAILVIRRRILLR
ncbi:hypothetical protein [Pseudonocardia endophytica]|uniref:Uncharacterized protein n=1 Tax=Pseudonocardia endophytica TaxID=401976 RepID=A0A4R1HJ38_PSEEN|nr:hypothetical protein [Pseudonocardia endophytica]TCK22334.1 hypothetical protein EV378_6335 [Pseudonocardia endophytica]